MASFSSLPQELVDRIADELYCEHPSVDEEARKALLACALVDKSFYEAARRHLLSEVAIHDRDSMNVALRRRLKLYPDTPDRLRSLRLHITNPYFFFASVPDLLPSLLAHPLNVKQVAILRNPTLSGSPSSPSGVLSTDLFKDLLSVVGSSIDHAHFFSTITTLHLRFLTFTLRHMVTFKCLQTLILEDCNFRGDEDGDSKVLSDHAAFKSLEVLSVSAKDHQGSLPRFQDVLYGVEKRRVAFSSLAVFRWVGGCSNLQSVSCFLRDYGISTNLVKLDMTIEIDDTYSTLDSHAPYPNPGYRLDLSALPKLRDLRLKWVLPTLSRVLLLYLRQTTIFSILRPSRSIPSMKVKNVHLSLSMPWSSDGTQLNASDGIQFKAWKDIGALDSIDQIISDAFLYPVLRTFRFSLLIRVSSKQEDEAKENSPILTDDLPSHFPLLNRSTSIKTSFETEVVIGTTQAPPRPTSSCPFFMFLPGIPHSQAASQPIALPPSAQGIDSEDGAYHDEEETEDSPSG
ncbi:hypothetical protein CVT26_013862 [Gymnopilus dilepis]|uniref:Uncharacterized protein n=1 Tax=Gymnopilus dilepis TaxID=231916 RepID=A0A409WT02_9AGAR|nr:hypothetical protein CVT26_013862 [Gymnopilus dilepis]